MHLKPTAEEVAFREEMRTFFTTQIPADIREMMNSKMVHNCVRRNRRARADIDETDNRPAGAIQTSTGTDSRGSAASCAATGSIQLEPAGRTLTTNPSPQEM